MVGVRFLDGFVKGGRIKRSLFDGPGVAVGFVEDSVSAVALRAIDCDVRNEALEIEIEVRCSHFS
jgi:hypothetical protein